MEFWIEALEEGVRTAALIGGAAFLAWRGQSHGLHGRPGWGLILAGLSLLALGSILDLADEFDFSAALPAVLIGEPWGVFEIFTEFVSPVFGPSLLMVGFLLWLPLPARLSKAESEVREANRGLQARVDEATRALAGNVAALTETAEALRTSEAQRVAVLSAIPDLIFVFDRDRRFAQFFAGRDAQPYVPPAEFLGRTTPEVLPPDVARIIDDAVAKAQGGASQEIQYTLPMPSGLKHFEARLAPMADGQVVGLARDVTERVKANQALQESRDALDQSNDAFFVIDPADARFVDVSARAALATGYSREELLGLRVLDLDRNIPGHEAWLGLVAQARREDGRIVLPSTMTRKDGSTFPVEVSVRLLDDPVRPRAIAVVRDTTERQKQEAELRRREALLAEAESIANMSSWEADLLTYKATWSPAAFELFDVPPDTPLSYETWLGCIHPEDLERVKEIADSVPATGKALEFECRIVHRDGSIRHTFNRTIPTLVDGKVVRLIGINQDVTAEKEAALAKGMLAAKELEAARLREVAAFKTQFLNNAAHELATPLTPIKLQMATLRGTILGDLNAGQRQSVEMIDRNLGRLAVLVQDLTDAARLQGGRLRLAQGAVDLEALASHGIASFAAKAAQEGIALVGPVGSPPPPFAGDTVRLDQVVVNLLSNALKFTPKGGRIEVQVGQGLGHAVLSVTDSGVGLTPGQIDHMFQPFSQVHDGSKLRVGGTGLGLYICKGIVEQHGGTLACRSPGPGRGTTFEVRLPLTAMPVLTPLARAA